MALKRRNGPFLYRGWYVCSIGGYPNHKLCREGDGVSAAWSHYKNWQEEVGRSQPLHGKRRKLLTRITVNDAIDSYLMNLKTTVGDTSQTHATATTALQRLRRFCGTMLLRTVDWQTGIAFKHWLAYEYTWGSQGKKLRPATVQWTIERAKTFFNWTTEPVCGLLLMNPWRKLTGVPIKPRQRLVTEEEFATLLGSIDDSKNPYLRDMLWLLRWTAMRPGEARNLTWADVLWDERRIFLPRDRVKTRTDRNVTLIPQALQLLRDRYERQKQLDPKYVQPDSQVFISRYGKKLNAETPAAAFIRLRQACVANGSIADYQGDERLVLYSARHTRCTEMLKDGIDMYLVSKEMGHSRVTTTEKHYSKLASQDVTRLILAKQAEIEAKKAASAKPTTGEP